MAELPVTPMLKLPLGSSALQLKHRPPARLVCPAGQGWQPAGAPATEEQPARHCVHTAAPAADVLPAGQYVQSAAPPAELLPAGHCAQPPGAHVAGWLPGAQVELGPGYGQPGARGQASEPDAPVSDPRMRCRQPIHSLLSPAAGMSALGERACRQVSTNYGLFHGLTWRWRRAGRRRAGRRRAGGWRAGGWRAGRRRRAGRQRGQRRRARRWRARRRRAGQQGRRQARLWCQAGPGAALRDLRERVGLRAHCRRHRLVLQLVRTVCIRWAATHQDSSRGSRQLPAPSRLHWALAHWCGLAP